MKRSPATKHVHVQSIFDCCKAQTISPTKPQDHVPDTRFKTWSNTADLDMLPYRQVQWMQDVQQKETAPPVIFFVVQNHMHQQLKQFAKQHKHLLKDFWVQSHGAACRVLSRLGLKVISHPPCTSLSSFFSHSAGDADSPLCGMLMPW